MTLDRRRVLTIAAAGAAAPLFKGPSAVANAAVPAIKAVAFDGFAILDPRPVFAVAKQLYPDHGDAFAAFFQTRLFEYQWLRALGGQYEDFLTIVDDAHDFPADHIGIEPDAEKRAQLRNTFLRIKAWPEAAGALEKLKAMNIRLAFVSNMTSGMLKSGLKNSGLDGVLDHVLSTDEVKTYKPDLRAYQIGVDAFGLEKEKILYAAFAGWDAAGAAWFGYPTIWINRSSAKPERLNRRGAVVGKSLDDLVQLIANRS